MEAGLTAASAEHAARGVADRELNAGFISKQTPLDARAGQTDRLPHGALGGGNGDEDRAAPREIQIEGDGPEALMEPLRQHDPEERLRSIADAQMNTDIAAAKAHCEAVKHHGGK